MRVQLLYLYRRNKDTLYSLLTRKLNLICKVILEDIEVKVAMSIKQFHYLASLALLSLLKMAH